jgi:hypothetical protein
MRIIYILISVLISSGAAVAHTIILTDPISISADDLVGGDIIDFSKNISVEQDVGDSNFECFVQIGGTNYDATSGKLFTLTSTSGSFDLTATFPKACINGVNALEINGTIPSNAYNAEIYSDVFKLAITYDTP